MMIQSPLTRFNRIYKEMDVIYHKYAKSLGISDTAFWILYCVSTHNASLTQRDLCNDWSFAPQTVNSALKDMEKRKLISLEPVPGNKKNKWIHLSEEGEKLVSDAIIPLIHTECDSFSVLSAEECEQMLSLTDRYATMLRGRIEEMIKRDKSLTVGGYK